MWGVAGNIAFVFSKNIPQMLKRSELNINPCNPCETPDATWV